MNLLCLRFCDSKKRVIIRIRESVWKIFSRHVLKYSANPP